MTGVANTRVDNRERIETTGGATATTGAPIINVIGADL
jgi:hypothetical protein